MLSKRLLEISRLIEKDKVVFDVGSDHGLLPCFLVEEGICPKAYASDNKEGPLNRARETIKKHHLEGRVIPVLGDGIENIADDVDIITICGMGFHTVKHILEGKDLSRYERIIVQINKDNDLLRQFINDNGYHIIDELVIEDNFYYQVEIFDAKGHNNYGAFEIKYGPCLLKKRDDVFLKYLRFRRQALHDIYLRSKDTDKLEEVKEIDKILNNEY